MMHLRGLLLFLLCLSGGARRSTRTSDSQRHHNMLADGLELSAEEQEALIPGLPRTGAFHHADARMGAFSKESKHHRAASSFRFGPRRATATLMADNGAGSALKTVSLSN